MFERFTDRARKVMALANQEAIRLSHNFIGTEHILLGLLKEGTGVGASVLKNMGINLQEASNDVRKLVKPGSELPGSDKLPQTPQGKTVIERAIAEARELGHNYVGTEHLLLGLLCVPEGTAAQVLMNRGLTIEAVRAGVLELLGAVKTEPSANIDTASRTTCAIKPRLNTDSASPPGVALPGAELPGAGLPGAAATPVRSDVAEMAALLAAAAKVAAVLGSPTVTAEHVLLALLGEPTGRVVQVLRVAGATPEAIRAAAEKLSG